MKILFIGNSYTYFNDMPKILERICRENGIELTTDSVVKGGYTLAHFLSLDNEYGVRAHALLSSEKYDFVVLQEQSLRPAYSRETFIKCVGELLPLIGANGATPLLYETWGRANGAQALKERNDTHDGMHAKIKEGYEQAGEKYGVKVVHAGDRLHEAYLRGEAVYNEDGSHPSPLGSEIVAREFFRELFSDAAKTK